MLAKITNKTTLKSTDMIQGYILNNFAFVAAYQLFSIVFLTAFLITLFGNLENKFSLLLSSGVFFLLCISLGFLYPIFQGLNWRNRIIKASGKDTVKVNYLFGDVFIKAESTIREFDFKVHYNEIEKIKENRKHLLLRLKEKRFILIRKDGFVSESECNQVIAMMKRISKSQ